MSQKTLKIGNDIDKEITSFSNKKPLIENSLDFKGLKEFLNFAIDKTIETVKEKSPCIELGIRVEEKLMERYKFEGLTIARLYSPIFWYLTLSEYEYNKYGKIKVVREALIPSIPAPKGVEGTVWGMDENVEREIQFRKEKIIDEIIKEHLEYFGANIEIHKISFDEDKTKL